jgi:hypothetical protein
VLNIAFFISVVMLNVIMLNVIMLNVVIRHERYCLEIFVKRDELERSSTEGPFNEILTDR